MSDAAAPGHTAPLGQGVVSNRPFQYLLWAAIGSSVGSQVGLVVITWLVYASTSSALAITALGIARIVPTIGIGIFAGAMIDRFDKRRLMIGCDVGRAVSFGLLALYILLFGATLPVILAMVLVTATLSTIFRPATNAVMPSLLTADQLHDGNALLFAGNNAANLVGSPIGGVLIVLAGGTIGLALNSATYVLSASLLALMIIPIVGRRVGPSEAEGPVAAGPSPASRTFFSEVVEGLAYLRSQRALLIVTLVSMGINFFISMWELYQVVYVVRALSLGATALGLLLGANTGGFMIGSFLPKRLRTKRNPGTWFAASAAMSGACILGLAFVSSLPAALALNAGAGLTLAISNLTWISTIQRTVPSKYLGRYFATDEAGSYAMIPAGQIVGGVLILAVGISSTYLIAGAGFALMSLSLLSSRSVREWGVMT